MPQCPNCGGPDAIPRKRPGYFWCPECRKHFTRKGSPRVLVLDVETLPIITTAWGTGKQFLSYDNVLKDYAIVSWAAKPLFSSQMFSDVMTPQEARARFRSVFTGKEDHADRRLLKRIWKLLDETDVVIHQNGKRFDMKKLNARFLYYGLPPYHPVQQIDTLEAAIQVFDPTSAKLDSMLKFLRLGQKLETEYDLWLGCMVGDPASLERMSRYNRHDVWKTEDYYATIRAWMPNHPNFSVWTQGYQDLQPGEVICHVCRAKLPRRAFGRNFRTPVGYAYEEFRCPHCGAIGRRNTRRPGQSIRVRSTGT